MPTIIEKSNNFSKFFLLLDFKEIWMKKNRNKNLHSLFIS